MEGLFFYLLGALTVVCALVCITRRNAVAAAFWLIFCFLGFAALFALLSAHLMAILQVLIYTGAIMVFFLFVTMFLGAERFTGFGRRSRLAGVVALLTLGAAALRVLGFLRGGGAEGSFPALAPDGGYGNVEPVSHLMLSEHLFSFMLTGLLLTVGVIGAVYLARREAPGSRDSKEELARAKGVPAAVGGGDDA